MQGKERVCEGLVVALGAQQKFQMRVTPINLIE